MDATWLPDGRQVDFSREVCFDAVAICYPRLWFVNADGRALNWFAPHPGSTTAVKSSFDGHRLTFARKYSGGVEPVTGQPIVDTTYWHIFTMQADGSDVRQVTQGSMSDDHPVWSPEGRSIAFMRRSYESASTGDLWVVGADGTAERQLVAGVISFDWQPIAQAAPPN